MKQCNFCEMIKWWTDRDNIFQQENPTFSSRLYVKYCNLSFRGGVKKTPQNSCASITSKSYRMKYCPCCGRKFTKEYNV